MPGFGIVFDAQADVRAERAAFVRALAAMHHDGRYRHETVAEEAAFQIGWTAYAAYPIRIWRQDGITLLFEGCVYDRSADDLTRLWARRAHGIEIGDVITFLREWTESADGDFAVVCATASPPGVVIALDSLGRLPVFWRHRGRRLLASREVKFITACSSDLSPDVTGIASTLALGFPLGERTLIEGVSRLPAGAILSWDPSRRSAPTLEQRPWSFDPAPPPGQKPHEHAAALAAEFVESCLRRNRTLPGRPIALSLSGGLDSRAVAAALKQIGAPGQARTFVYPGGTSDPEADIARAIAASCGLPWRLFRLGEAPVDAMDRLIRMKDGLNSAAMAYADEYLTRLLEDVGDDAVLWTGEGGGNLLPPRHPHRSVRSDADLCPMLLARCEVFGEADVASILAEGRSDIRGELLETVRSLPERSLAGKYLHFFLLVIHFKLYFEGEDRNRCYLWTSAPFFSRPLFDRVVCTPFDWKKRRLLQTRFLRCLDPGIAGIRDANTGLVPGSSVFQARQAFREFVLGHSAFEALLRGWRRARTARAGSGPEPLRTRLLQMAHESPVLADVFDRTRLASILERRPGARQTYMLYTICRYLSEVTGWTGRSGPS